MAYKLEGHGKKKPAWRTNANAAPNRRIGIEFEIENELGYQEILDAIPETLNLEEEPVTERDGSLLEGKGVEIVFPPFKHSQIKDAASFFGRTLKALEECGAESNVRCGMHMNVSTMGWTDDTKRNFLYFLNRVDALLLQRIGGRALNGFCSQRRDVTWVDMLYVTEHVVCAGLRPNRIEVRFPQATMDQTKVGELVDFLDLLQDWSALGTTRDLLSTNPVSGAMVAEFFHFLTTNKRKPRKSARVLEILRDGR